MRTRFFFYWIGVYHLKSAFFSLNSLTGFIKWYKLEEQDSHYYFLNILGAHLHEGLCLIVTSVWKPPLPPHISTGSNSSLLPTLYLNVILITNPFTPPAPHIVGLLHSYFFFFFHSIYYCCHLCNLLFMFIVCCLSSTSRM